MFKNSDNFENVHLILYLLQMTNFGKVARPIGSVDEVNLVETVDVENCLTVLKQKHRKNCECCPLSLLIVR